jgi:hypothetical protein
MLHAIRFSKNLSFREITSVLHGFVISRNKIFMRKMETQVKNYQPLVTPRQVGSGIEKFVI